jgi:hypothetical protein
VEEPNEILCCETAQSKSQNGAFELFFTIGSFHNFFSCICRYSLSIKEIENLDKRKNEEGRSIIACRGKNLLTHIVLRR